MCIRDSGREVDAGRSPVADDHAAVDQNVTDGPRHVAPHELAGEVAPGHPGGVGGVEYDEVGSLAHLEGADPVAEADRPGAVDRREGERLLGSDGIGQIPVAFQAGEQVGRQEDVRGVAGVVCVAAQCDPPAAPHQFGVAGGSCVALGETQVGPRAGGDRGIGLEDRVHLRVVEPHGVAQQQARAEHSQLAEVDHRPAPAAQRVRLDVGGPRRDVPGQLDVEPFGQTRRSGEELVAREVVAHERHPPGDRPGGRQGPDDVLLPGEYLVDGRAERHVLGVPAPAPDARADTRGAEPRRDAFRVGHCARLQHRGDAPGQTLHRGDGRGQFVVVAVGVGVQRDDPVEDRLLRADVVRNHAAHEGIDGRVLVGVDQTRDHDTARRVDLPRAREAGAQVLGRAQRGDAGPGHGDRRSGEDSPSGVHGDDVAAHDQEIGHGLITTLPMVSRAASTAQASARSSSGNRAAVGRRRPPAKQADVAATKSAEL